VNKALSSLSLAIDEQQSSIMFHCYRLIYLIGLLFLVNSGVVSAQTTHPAVSQNSPLEKVRLQLKWFHQFQFAGYYAAIQQGYYAEEGLEVELLERKLDHSVIDQVVGGDAEYGVGDSGLLHEYALGKPIVALAAIFQHNPLVFMTRQESGIISPFEMKGKRIMLDTLNANEAPLKTLLADAKLSDNDFTLIKQSGDNSLLTRGQLDVMTGYLTDQPFYYKKNGVKINI
jgi:ABC-type nitrate/sulfonate/bicarbonate transport system substrate-binding protein